MNLRKCSSVLFQQVSQMYFCYSNGKTLNRKRTDKDSKFYKDFFVTIFKMNRISIIFLSHNLLKTNCVN